MSALAVLGKIWRAIRWRRVCRMIDANPEEAQEALRILDSQDWEDEGQERLPTGNKA